jgi:sugar (pentulose or hexulose) kinase
MRWMAGLALMALLVTGAVRAQSAPAVTLDADDRLVLTLLSSSVARANKECETLTSQLETRALRTQVEARMKAKHGITLAQAVQSLTPAKAAQ